MKRALFFVCLLMTLIFSPGLFAQDMELYVEPTQCYTGSHVRVFGFVKPNAQGATIVELEFVKPISGETLQRQATANAGGEYEYVFSDTQETGEWRVRATKKGTSKNLPGGKLTPAGARPQGIGKKMEATFTVSSRIFMARLVQDLDSLNEEEEEVFQALLQQVINYPGFPGKEEAIKEIDEALDKLTTLENLYKRLDEAVKEMEDALEKNGASIPPAAQAALGKAAAAAVRTSNRLTAEKAQIESLIDASQKAAEWCHLWKCYRDVMVHLNFISNFIVDGIKDLGLNLMIAKRTENMDPASAQRISTVTFMLGVTASGGVSLIGGFNFLMGTLTNLGTSVLQDLMSKYCTLYEGDVEGNYKAEVLHRGLPFFSMTYRMEGKMSLIFQKRQAGDPAVHLKGDMRAKAKGFDCTLDMVPFDLPHAFTPTWCRNPIPPLASRSVMLYLEGKAQDDKMELKVETVGYDYKLKARSYYVIIGGHSPIPIPGRLEFPLMNGEWFFTRVTKLSQRQVEYLNLPISVKGGSSIAEKEFNREIFLPETKNRKAVRVTMSFKINLKSPPAGAPPLGGL